MQNKLALNQRNVQVKRISVKQKNCTYSECKKHVFVSLAQYYKNFYLFSISFNARIQLNTDTKENITEARLQDFMYIQGVKKFRIQTLRVVEEIK